MLQRKPFITQVDTEIAVPFVVLYFKRWEIPIDLGGIENVWWFGAWYRNACRAVMGFQNTDDPETLFVYGFYGDGTPHEIRPLNALGKAIDALPFNLVGNIHLPNSRMFRSIAAHGWKIDRFIPDRFGARVSRSAAYAYGGA